MKSIALLSLLVVSAFSTLEAGTIEFTISPTVQGLGTNPVLNFTMEGEILSGSTPISKGADLVAQSSKGFTNAVDAAVFMTWLIQSGKFDEYRSFMNKFTVSTANPELWKMMNTDDILSQQQKFIKDTSDLKPLLMINLPDGIQQLLYIVQGEKRAVYPLSFKKDGDICKMVLSSMGNGNDSHIIYALMEQVSMNHDKSIEYHLVKP